MLTKHVVTVRVRVSALKRKDKRGNSLDFFAVARFQETRMNETDQKILERPELGWDPRRNHTSDFEDDRDEFVGSVDRYDEGKE